MKGLSQKVHQLQLALVVRRKVHQLPTVVEFQLRRKVHQLLTVVVVKFQLLQTVQHLRQVLARSAGLRLYRRKDHHRQQGDSVLLALCFQIELVRLEKVARRISLVAAAQVAIIRQAVVERQRGHLLRLATRKLVQTTQYRQCQCRHQAATPAE